MGLLNASMIYFVCRYNYYFYMQSRSAALGCPSDNIVLPLNMHTHRYYHHNQFPSHVIVVPYSDSMVALFPHSSGDPGSSYQPGSSCAEFAWSPPSSHANSSIFSSSPHPKPCYSAQREPWDALLIQQKYCKCMSFYNKIYILLIYL